MVEQGGLLDEVDKNMVVEAELSFRLSKTAHLHLATHRKDHHRSSITVMHVTSTLGQERMEGILWDKQKATIIPSPGAINRLPSGRHFSFFRLSGDQ